MANAREKHEETQGQSADVEDEAFASMTEAVAAVLGKEKVKDKEAKGANWYNKSVDYWSKVDASVDGVLGGFGYISDADIADSMTLLNKLFPTAPDGSVVVDCGAGVGRISKDLLQHKFDVIDLVEPDERYITAAKAALEGKVGTAHQCGLQDFNPLPQRYLCVWIQWVLNYLTDEDLEATLRRCLRALLPGGYIVVKENTSRSETYVLDRADTSVTRPDKHFRRIFKRSGFRICRTYLVQGLPEGLFPVRTYVLRPKKS